MKNEKKRSYRKYDDSFKEEALNLLRKGRTIKELSKSLGVSEGVLYSWKTKSSGAVRNSNDDSKKLKKEIQRLKEENEILKKALSIFSQTG